MAGIQAPGVGSSLDINSIVSQLVAAEKAPVEKRLANDEALTQARLSTLGIVKSSVSDFQTAISSLTSLSSFQSKTISIGNESLFSASASSAAKPGQHSVEVTKLAQAQKLASPRFTSTTDSVGTGTLHIKFGTYDSGLNTFTENAAKQGKDIAITPDKSSLSGIRDAINAAGIGVSASILNDGTGSRLVISSESGAAQGLQITVTDNDGTSLDDASGLSRLAFDPTAAIGSGKNAEQTLEPRDAQMKVDGISVTRSSNSVTGVIPGVTLDLKNIAVGVPTTLTVSENKTSIKDSVEKFVTSFNALKGVLNKTTKYDSTQKKASLLTGDSAIRSMNNQMQRVMGDVVTGLNSNVRALADIGITSARDGTLTLDSAKLNTALQSNIDDFAALFATTGHTSDSLVSYVKAGSNTKVGSYDVNITQVATQGSYSNSVGAGPFTIDADNDAFKIKVDGVESGQINLTQQSGLTGEGLAKHLESKINADSTLKNAGRSVSVAYAFDSGTSTGSFTIKSSRYGVDSKIEVTQIEVGSPGLGLTIQAGVDGKNVAGTIGGVAATGSGTQLLGTGDAEDLKIDVAGGTTGFRGTVSYSKGYAEQLKSVLNGFLASDGALTQRINDYNEHISSIAERRTALNQHLTKLEARFRAQFGVMDAMVGKMKATGDYLTAQLSSLSNNK